MSLAIFDLDETLIRGDTASLFCRFMVDTGLADGTFVDREQELMQRQVYLRNGEAGTIYGYAASWWGVDTCVPAPARAPLMPPDADAAADVALAAPLDGTAPNRQDEGVHDGPGDAHLDEPRPRRT